MGKVIKILSFAVVVLLFFLVGLMVFVKFYVTEDRIRPVMISQAENALGRKVDMGEIRIGLFEGITIKDLSVKEKDGKSDLSRVNEFVLKYDLAALIEKKLVIREIILKKPYISVIRGRDGQLNVEDIPILKQPRESQRGEMPSSEKKEAKGIPLALIIEKISIENGRLKFRDDLGEFPEADTTFNILLRVSSGHETDGIKYSGKGDFKSSLVRGEKDCSITGRVKFSQEKAEYDLDVTSMEQTVHLKGSASGWTTEPRVVLDIYGDGLDLKKLAEISKILPQGGGHQGKTDKKIPSKTSASLASTFPKGFSLTGHVKVSKAVYQGLVLDKINSTYGLTDGMAVVDELDLKTSGGIIRGSLRMDLNDVIPPFEGQVSIEDLKSDEILAAFGKGEMLSGVLSADASFAGKGLEWSEIKKTLSSEGTYRLTDARIGENRITTAISVLISLPELKKLAFKEVSGNFHVKDGKVILKSLMSGKDVGARLNGSVGFDGAIDIPVTLTFSEKYSRKLAKKTSIAKYVLNDKGKSKLQLRLKGTIKKPYPTLDASAVGAQIEKKIEKKVLKELEKALSDKKKDKIGDGNAGDPAKQIIKEIFGQ